MRQVGNTEVGKTVRVVVLRDGASKTLKIVLGRREDAEVARTTQTAASPDCSPGKVASAQSLPWRAWRA